MAGGAKILEPVGIFENLPCNDGGVLTAMRCYIATTDLVTSQVTLHATERRDGAILDGNGTFSGAAAAEFLLASTPISAGAVPVVPGLVPHDGQTIATFKLLGGEAVPFEHGLFLFAEVTTLSTTAIGQLMYIRAVVEGFTYHRCQTCGAYPRGEG